MGVLPANMRRSLDVTGSVLFWHDCCIAFTGFLSSLHTVLRRVQKSEGRKHQLTEDHRHGLGDPFL